MKSVMLSSACHCYSYPLNYESSNEMDSRVHQHLIFRTSQTSFFSRNLQKSGTTRLQFTQESVSTIHPSKIAQLVDLRISSLFVPLNHAHRKLPHIYNPHLHTGECSEHFLKNEILKSSIEFLHLSVHLQIAHATHDLNECTIYVWDFQPACVCLVTCDLCQTCNSGKSVTTLDQNVSLRIVHHNYKRSLYGYLQICISPWHQQHYLCIHLLLAEGRFSLFCALQDIVYLLQRFHSIHNKG